jgi:hypothetical protein
MNNIASWGWTAAGWVAVIGLLGVIVRQVSPWRQQKIDAEQQFRDALLKRVDKLEAALERERTARMRAESLLRHRVANAEQALDLFIELIEAQPEKAAHHAARIKERREKDRDRLAKESAAVHAAMAAEADALAKDAANEIPPTPIIDP